MDRTVSRYRPIGRAAIEQGATSANFTAFEDLLLPIDGIDDIQHADLVRRPRQFKPAAHAFSGHHQFCLGQFGEYFRQIVQGHALQFSQVAHARLTGVAAVAHQKKPGNGCRTQRPRCKETYQSPTNVVANSSSLDLARQSGRLSLGALVCFKIFVLRGMDEVDSGYLQKLIASIN